MPFLATICDLLNFPGNSMAEAFSEIVNKEINKVCPVKEVKISQLEGKVNSLALQKLVRQKKREYEKHGCSKRFKELKRKVKDKIKKEAENAIDKLPDPPFPVCLSYTDW